MSIATLAQVKAYLGTDRTDEDGWLQSLLDSTQLSLERVLAKRFDPYPAFAPDQVLAVTATGGTLTLTYGATTAAIAFNAPAEDVEDALEVLAGVGVGNVSCSGGPLASAPVTVRFFLPTPQGTLTADGTLLTGPGHGATVTPTTDVFDSAPPVRIEVPIELRPSQIAPPFMVPPQPWMSPNPQPPFRASLADVIPVRIPHARSVTQVEVDNQTQADPTTVLTSAQYMLEADPTLYAAVPGAVTFARRVVITDLTINAPSTMFVTGKFGITPAPGDLVDAVYMIVARRYKERDARYGDQVMLPEGQVVNYFRQFNAFVRATVDSYTELGA